MIYGSTASKYWTFGFDVYEDSTSVANNSSRVRVEVYIGRGASAGASYMHGATISCIVSCTGCSNQSITYSNPNRVDVAAGGWLHIGTAIFSDVPHNPDGSQTVTIDASFTNTVSPANGSAKGNVTLTTIARASTPSLSTQNFTVGDNVYLYTNRKSTAFTHELFLRHNDGLFYGSLVSGITDSINIANYSQIADIIYQQMPNSKGPWNSCFLLRTWNGGSIVGDNVVWFNAYIAENSSTKPTVTMSISPTELEDWVETDYVQGKSQVKAEMAASAKLHASVKSYNVTVDDKTTTLATKDGSASVTTQVLNNSGTFAVVGKSIDTRDIPSNEESANITVIPYGKPFITHNSSYGNIVCERFDEEKGVVDDSGTSIKLIVGAKWYSLSNKENTAKIEVRCVGGATDSGWITLDAIAQGGGAENNYVSYYDINTIIPNVTVATDKTYSVYIRCTDRFGAYNGDSEIPYKIPTEDVCFHLGRYGNKAAFGKYAEDEKTLEIAPEWDLKLKGNKLTDFIIEQDTSGIWTYEKWASGKAVCYGKKNYGTMATHAWGYLFETDGMNIDFPSGLFIENPQVMHIDFLYGGGIGGFIEKGAVVPTKDSIGEFCVARASQLTYSNLTIGFYIVGKWK